MKPAYQVHSKELMIDLAKQPCFLSPTTVTETAGILCRLSGVVASCLLLFAMSSLTGCGAGENGGQPSLTAVGSSASLEWSPVQDPSVSTYFVHYGRQSPDQQGSCSYESSVSVDSPSATVTNLEPNTLYYFSVSAYNGLESDCSNEVSAVTSPV
jgi:Fibronectin type III domain